MALLLSNNGGYGSPDGFGAWIQILWLSLLCAAVR
jgi:hypothetical protein